MVSGVELPPVEEAGAGVDAADEEAASVVVSGVELPPVDPEVLVQYFEMFAESKGLYVCI